LGRIATIIGQNGGNISHVLVDVSDKSMARVTLRFNQEAGINAIIGELNKIGFNVNLEKV